MDCNGWVDSLHVKYALPTAGIYSPILMAKSERVFISEALYKACCDVFYEYPTIARVRVRGQSPQVPRHAHYARLRDLRLLLPLMRGRFLRGLHPEAHLLGPRLQPCLLLDDFPLLHGHSDHLMQLTVQRPESGCSASSSSLSMPSGSTPLFASLSASPDAFSASAGVLDSA